jgi:hypothetical protein
MNFFYYPSIAIPSRNPPAFSLILYTLYRVIIFYLLPPFSPPVDYCRIIGGFLYHFFFSAFLFYLFSLFFFFPHRVAFIALNDAIYCIASRARLK